MKSKFILSENKYYNSVSRKHYKCLSDIPKEICVDIQEPLLKAHDIFHIDKINMDVWIINVVRESNSVTYYASVIEDREIKNNKKVDISVSELEEITSAIVEINRDNELLFQDNKDLRELSELFKHEKRRLFITIWILVIVSIAFMMMWLRGV